MIKWKNDINLYVSLFFLSIHIPLETVQLSYVGLQLMMEGCKMSAYAPHLRPWSREGFLSCYTSIDTICLVFTTNKGHRGHLLARIITFSLFTAKTKVIKLYQLLKSIVRCFTNLLQFLLYSLNKIGICKLYICKILISSDKSFKVLFHIKISYILV